MMEMGLVFEMLVYLNYLTWLSAWKGLSLYKYEENAFIFPFHIEIVDLKFIPHGPAVNQHFSVCCLKMHKKNGQRSIAEVCYCVTAVLQHTVLCMLSCFSRLFTLPTSPAWTSFSETQFGNEVEAWLCCYNSRTILMLPWPRWKQWTFANASNKGIVAGLSAWSHRTSALKEDSIQSRVNVAVKKEKEIKSSSFFSHHVHIFGQFFLISQMFYIRAPNFYTLVFLILLMETHCPSITSCLPEIRCHIFVPFCFQK